MKRWNILSIYDPEKKVYAQILANRGITDIESFLNTPSIADYFSSYPLYLKVALKEAKEIILNTIKDQETIVIYGDYDADGICSTAILYQALVEELKYSHVYYFIPNRFEHGYCLSINAVEHFLKNNQVSANALFITVDTGITAVNEVKYLKEKSYQVIVVDHHQKPKVLPEAEVIVWSDQVVASTLSWFLSRVIGAKDPATISLAALATVTDIQTLLGMNRSILKKGLEIFNTSPPLGIRELIKASGKAGSEITTYDLGWVIGPRLNASGRLVSAEDSLLLLTEKNEVKVKEIARRLNDLNNERQDKTIEMYNLAAVLSEGTLPKIIFSENENYHEGIIGLVAAKLVQKYYRPAVVISLSDGYGKGSARSVKGVDIISFLRHFEDLFENLGGHPMAAGFTIKQENISILKNRALEIIDEWVSEEMLVPELVVDLKIPAEIISMGTVEEIEKLKPFGLGNDEPVFLCENLGVSEINSMGKDNRHTRLNLYQGGSNYRAVFFDGAEKIKDLKFGDKIDLVFNLKKNCYNGKNYVDIVVRDFRKTNSLGESPVIG